MNRSTTCLGAVLLACALAAGRAGGAVVISEIHYHPVEAPAFNADGTPFLQLTNDVHEFVEIQNTGAGSVDLGGWRLTGGIAYTFPTNTAIEAGAFRVVARVPERLATVYGIPAGTILGPYDGALGNSSDTVRLRDASDSLVDAVTYDSQFPWAQSADALGAQDRFTGLYSTNYQYKGRSLQRVSVTWSSGDPANWLASPLSGPTPGGAQTVTRTIPKPVVVAKSAVQSADGAAIVRASNTVSVTCTFSATNGLGTVVLESFVDDVNSTAEAHTNIAMAGLGSATYAATLPGRADRSIVRYRFKADRGDGVEVVSPRPDDPQIAPVGTNMAREAWFGYFVTPVRTSSNPVYDVVVSAASLGQMNTNIIQSPKRVTVASAAGVPRDIPYVAPTAPLWDGTQPGVFACNGQVWDIQIRYHGSMYHRAAANNSFKLHFPSHQPFNAQSSWYVTGHANEFVEGQRLNRLIGLPASQMRWIDWYYNSNSLVSRTVQGEYADEMLDAYHELQQQLNPGSAKEQNGELYKVVGNRDPSQNNNEGPYTRGDEAPMLTNAVWTQLQRYDWTMSIQNHAWKGSKPVRDLVEGMWTARGDSPATHNFQSNATALANARSWFTNNWDMDATLTSMALLEWMSIWDDACQNHFFWRRASGKWARLGWDYDSVMSTSGGGGSLGGSTNQTIYGGEAGAPIVFDGTNWWKDTFFKCFRTEYNQRLWDINNSFCDPTNLTALGFSNAATFARSRQRYINTQLAALGTYTKPARPANVAPSNGAIVVSATNLGTSAYSHTSGVPHAATKWELRTASGDYEEPVIRTTSTLCLTNLPVPFDQLTYGQTYYWRATHIDTNGHASIVSAETCFSWGSTNATAGTLVINEVLADNRGAVQNSTTIGDYFPEFIELRNNGSSNLTLAGYTLTDNPLLPAKYAFPTGATLAAGAQLVVWCDDDTNTAGYHSGFSIDKDGDQVLLLNRGTLVDSVAFGPQAPDVSIGRILNGTGGWQANTPTPGAANSARTLGAATRLRLNEWMANPAYGDDWFEIYNSDSNTVALSGLYLSDTPADPAVTRIPALSFIEPGGFTRFWADGRSSGGAHANFKLDKNGESLVLSAANGVTPIDTVTFGAQSEDVSEGRLPDGADTLVDFSAPSASPGYMNWAPCGIVIQEVMSHTEAPFEDAVELANVSSSAVDIGGWWLSDYRMNRRKFQIPSGTTLPAGGTIVFYAADFAAGSVPFALSAFDDEVVLSAVDGNGALTGYGACVHFPPSAANVSFGRVTATGLAADSGGAEFWPLTAPTFGQDSPASVAVFRTGTGAANAAPLVGPVTINEIMYHPPDTTNGADVTSDEFIELANVTTNPVDLGGWRLAGDTGYTFPAGAGIGATGYLLVVSFSPTNAAALAAFRSSYGLATNVTVCGPYSDALANSTMELELEYPAVTGGYSTFIPVDRVAYRDLAPWPTTPDGQGPSLQRMSSSVIGNTAANWTGATSTPGRANAGVVAGLSITTASPLRGGVAGVAYSNTLSAAGGVPPYTWTLTSGAVTGLALSAAGVFSGTPATARTNSLAVRVDDAGGAQASRVLAWIVAASSPAVVTTSLPAGTSGVAYAAALAATGGTPPYAWALVSGSLPSGVTLNASGVLGGTPGGAGVSTGTVQVTDGGELTAARTLCLAVVWPPLAITALSPLPSAPWGVAYSQALTASGGAGAYRWSVTSGSLPPGLTLSDDGTLSGSPATPGTYAFTVQVADADGATASAGVSLTVTSTPLTIATAALPDGVCGDAYAATLAADGGVGSRTWTLAAGALPPGLALASAGSLTGTPTAVGASTFVVQVSDSLSATSRAYTVAIEPFGAVDHFVWDYVPATAYASNGFAVRSTARDGAGRVVSNFSGNISLGAVSGTNRTTSPVLVTELCDGAENQIELQNVSTGAVDVTGWYLLVGDSQTDINIANPVKSVLTGTLSPGGLLRLSESNTTAGGRVYFGGAIGWSAATNGGRSWVMLCDGNDALRDVVATGWTAAELGTLSVEINGNAVPPGSEWTGAGLAAGARAPQGMSVDAWQRAGPSDTNSSNDWAWCHHDDNSDATSLGATNSGLSLPMSMAAAVPVAPTNAACDAGAFLGCITVLQAAGDVHLGEADGDGHAGVSAGLTVYSGTDTDGDGLPDAWEADNGLVVGVDDGAADPDGDGVSNLGEFVAGTNPQSGASALRIIAVTAADGECLVEWNGVAGRLYRFSTSPDLVAWSTGTGVVLATASTTQLTAVASGGMSSSYVRVEVVPGQ